MRLTDFGLSKENMGANTESTSFVGSIAYLGPEVLKKQPHTRSLDWYLVGVLMYELIVGYPPYYDHNRKQLFSNILGGPLKIPHTMSSNARDLILDLLNRNPKKRLGAGPTDALEIKVHKFFADLNWQDVENQKLEMPTITAKLEVPVNQAAQIAFKKSEIES